MPDPHSESTPTASIGPGAPRAGAGGFILENPGTRIGAYTLLSILGEGGFGVVWLAEQSQPISRKVALKIIKPGMDSAAIVARFEHERQTLAMMDHPNIAKVFDAGSTEGGRPYFVMEYVPGAPITDFCDRHELSVRERLDLMARVCDAVQHAHAKGVIHRDIKPSNVLVQNIDGNPLPKIIDFGIARAIQRNAAAKEHFTLEGVLIGTPEYMSPEQAAGMLDLDTRADVYALGVMLYELLTGAPPFESRSLRVAGLAEIQRLISSVEPPRPSTRLAELGAEAEAVARLRRVHLPTLQRELRRELEWIPLKAMRKDRERRYATAQEMAADIRRYLGGEALSAGPESRVYRARKFVRRNRLPVGAAAVVLLAVVASAAISIRFGISEHEARLAASAAKQKAEYESQTAEAVNKYLVDGVLTSSDPEEDGPGVLVETVLDRAADALDTELASRPNVQMRVAATLGKSLVRVGRPERARDVLMKARDLATGKLAETTDARDTLPEIDEFLAEALFRQAKGPEAVRILQGRLAALPTSTNSADLIRRSNLLNQLGGALKWSQPPDFDASERAYKESLALRQANLPPNHIDVLVSRHNLAMLALRRGQNIALDHETERLAAFAQALPLEQHVRSDTEAALGPEHPQTLIVRAEEARLLFLTSHGEEADRAYASTIEAMRRVLGIHHWRTLDTLGNWSLVLHQLGRYEQEERVLREATEGFRWVHGPTNPGTQTCAEWLASAEEKTGCPECGARTLAYVHGDLVTASEPAARRQAVAEQVARIYDRMGAGEKAREWRSIAAREHE